MNLGTLFIVSSPIGNLEDTTFRALSTLKEADFILAEDTRRTKKLLTHFTIKTPLQSYRKDNEHRKTESILEAVKTGKKIAMVVDSGTPCVSDPGYYLIREAVRQGIEPVVIPGVSALIYAIVACGLPVSQFFFAGFLPKKKLKRRKFLGNLAESKQTFFLFESPYRINLLLTEIAEELGADTQVVLMREATKVHEETIRGSAGELSACYKEKKWKGEFTIAVTTYATSTTYSE